MSSDITKEERLKDIEGHVHRMEFAADKPELLNKNDFEFELQTLINKFSKENGSDTPDFILATYLNDCLESFNNALQRRAKWYEK